MKLLDCTVRDGSYAVDFKWTKQDVRQIITKLENLGFEYIEIGHGLGLNASSMRYGISILSDSEYMEIAQESLRKAKFGFFCIPGIATLDDLKKAKDNGVSFVRIGVNADSPELAVPYIKEAKKNNIETMANYMKSYIVPPDKFADAALIARDNGADAVYIVDSAGCMMRNDVEAFYESAKKKTDVKLGFHGHNNLGLAVSNSVFCTELGFDFVDCTLQGIGRSIGNTASEQLVMVLVKKGVNIKMDIPRLLEWGYSLIKEVSDRQRFHPLDLICGYAGFHSSFLRDVYKCCMEKNVDPLRLIIAYSKENKASMEYDLLCRVAESLPEDYDENPYSFREYFFNKSSD